MADPFSAAIASVLTGLGYQCQEVAVPTYRDYDPAQPTVYIAPVSKPAIGWIAFATKSVRQAYDVVYAYKNDLDPAELGNDVWDFKAAVIAQFQGLNDALTTAGAWNSTVVDGADYDRPLFKKGYTYSHVRVLVDYLSN